jgi:hypothetical protein
VSYAGYFEALGTQPVAIHAHADSGAAIEADSAFYAIRALGAIGVSAGSTTPNGFGVEGLVTATSGTNYGVWGSALGAAGYGVYSAGNFASNGTKSFQIDHPLDPENKYLNHYCEEGPEPLNVYRGNATLDNSGEAWVTLPDYFDEINRDPSYTLTPLGFPAPLLHIAREIADRKFLIAGGAPGQRVSWRVEAIRNDRFVRTYGAPAEPDKPANFKGTYLQPELYGQPRTRAQFQAPPTPH